MFYKVLMPNGKQLASHDAGMMMHPLWNLIVCFSLRPS